jgi:hypothetical protein
MDLVQSLLEAGSKGLRHYLDCAGKNREDAVPERGLCARIAIQLHETLELEAPIEEPYSDLIGKLGIPMDAPLNVLVEGLKADIAAYRKGVPLAVIEVKVFTDTRDKIGDFARDLRKGDLFKLGDHVPILGLALICETRRRLTAQIERIGKSMGMSLICSAPTQTRSGEDWSWCFACIPFGPSAQIAAFRA